MAPAIIPPGSHRLPPRLVTIGVVWDVGVGRGYSGVSAGRARPGPFPPSRWFSHSAFRYRFSFSTHRDDHPLVSGAVLAIGHSTAYKNKIGTPLPRERHTCEVAISWILNQLSSLWQLSSLM